MSSTNKTTNYELSQYVGTDKPTYLGDYNSDMLKIDTQMKANADEIIVAKTSAQTANTTANTALSNAQTANQNAQSATATAGQANTTANSALSKANANEAKILEIEETTEYSATEKVIGKWIDNKPLYRKVIDLGEMPTTLNPMSGFYTKIVDIEINANDIQKTEMCMKTSSIFAPIPFSNLGNDGVTYYISGTNLTIHAKTARTGYTARVIVEYTKSTD